MIFLNDCILCTKIRPFLGITKKNGKICFYACKRGHMRKLSSSVYLVIRYWKFCNPFLSKLKTKLDEFGDQSRRVWSPKSSTL